MTPDDLQCHSEREGYEAVAGNRKGKIGMSGRARLPGGDPRKASQRNARRGAPKHIRVAPTWQPGDTVYWKDRSGTYRRDVDDGEHSEIAIAERVYRVRTNELT